MANYLISGMLLTLVIVLFISRGASKERSIARSAAAIAAAMLMSIDDLYVIVDGWFGANDIIHIASTVVLMVGVFYFARGVTRVGLIENRWINWMLGAPALIIASTLASAGFFLTDRYEGGTSTTFMATYGDQPGAALYSISQYLYLLIVLFAMAVTAVRQLRGAESRHEKTVSWLLLVGSTAGVWFSISVIVMDIAHVAGSEEILDFASMFYHPLEMFTFLFLVTGLITAPIVRHVRERQREKTLHDHLERIDELWKKATVVSPKIKVNVDKHSAHAEHRLHRRIIEIRDAALDRSNEFQLTEFDRTLLAEVEDHLVAGTA